MKVLSLILISVLTVGCSENSDFFNKNSSRRSRPSVMSEDRDKLPSNNRDEVPVSQDDSRPTVIEGQEKEDSSHPPIPTQESEKDSENENVIIQNGSDAPTSKDQPKNDSKPQNGSDKPTTKDQTKEDSKPGNGSDKPTTKDQTKQDSKPGNGSDKPTTKDQTKEDSKPGNSSDKPTTKDQTKEDSKPGNGSDKPTTKDQTKEDSNQQTEAESPKTKSVRITDKFTQSAESKHKVDILWVVDNSASMSDEQEALGVYFHHFIENFVTQEEDFQMAITTTDGKYVASAKTKLNSKAAQQNPRKFKDDFTKLIKVGVKGSGKEKGLASLEAFLTTDGKNFLRKDAYLAVIVVSDEEDQSPKTVDQYLKVFQKIKSNSGLVKVYSIVDTKLTNKGHKTIATGFKRYAKVSEATSGGVYNIRNRFDDVLSGIGEQLITLLHSFALSHEPLNDDFDVMVNGRRETEFSFNEDTRSIVFDSRAVPEAKAKIEVTYKAKIAK